MSGPAVVVENLVKRFGSVVALDGIDLSVPAGTIFGLLGPNGAGKTTAVRILSTILTPDAGRAHVLGFDVVADAAAVRYSIGLAGQDAAVDPNLTGHENLRLIGRLTHQPRRSIAPRADELLERMRLGDAAHRPVKTYSGGMRRRLDLAAALVHRPSVLFLDEPTTGLDPQSRRDLWALIRELVSEGTTVLLTTQYLEEADVLADTVSVIDGGRVIAEDSPAALKARLGGAVIEMGWASDALAVRAFEIVARAAGKEPEREGATVRITSDHGARLLVDVLRALDGDDLAPAKLAVREPSLDDVFLRLTGHHVDADASALPPKERAR